MSSDGTTVKRVASYYNTILEIAIFKNNIKPDLGQKDEDIRKSDGITFHTTWKRLKTVKQLLKLIKKPIFHTSIDAKRILVEIQLTL